MNAKPVAFDTNILIHALGGVPSLDTVPPERHAQAAEANRKAMIAQRLVAAPAIISVQILNEFTNVAKKKLGFTLDEIHGLLESLQAVHTITDLTWATTQLALAVARDVGYSFYDSLIVAAALIHGCETLYTEDMDHGRVILRALRIVNPFKPDVTAVR